MKTKVFFLALVIVALGFGGCAMGTYTISTTSFKQYAFGGGAVAGIKFVNNTPYELPVELGPLSFTVPSGTSTRVSYGNRSIFVQRNYNLYIEVVILPPVRKIGQIHGAKVTWDYSQWTWNWENNDWSTVNEKSILMELSDDGKQILLQ
ncbi:MAG: hypothetical protein AAB631_02090 [Patescibacteria group bacterium]